jgi:hypothetical protein
MYSITILLTDDTKVGTLWYKLCFHVMKRIMGFSQQQSTRMARHRFFESFITTHRKYKPPEAPTKQTSHDKPLKNEQMERIFAGATLSVFKQTAIYALFKLKEVHAACGTKVDSAHPKLYRRAFIYWCTPKDEHYFDGRCTSINFGVYLEEYRDIIELLYLNRGR